MKQKNNNTKFLTTVAPYLLKEWNYEKNTSISPESITYGSKKKVWWKCSEGHEWEAAPHNRIKGTGCPKCASLNLAANHNKSIIETRGSLFNNRPDLAKEWNYEKNGQLTPNDVTCGSKKKVWWKCSEGHEWETSVYNRNRGSGCIYCAGQKAIKGVNDLKTTNPELVEEWDYEKNNGLLPEDVKARSNLLVWWKCELGHSWKTTVGHRTYGTGCPHCYKEYGTSFPEQAICYYLSKITNVKNREKINKQEIDIYLPNYEIGFEYDGSYYHESEKSKLKDKIKNNIIECSNISLYRIKESDKSYFDKDDKIIYCIIDKDYKYIEKVLCEIQSILQVKIDDIDIVRDRQAIYKQYVKHIKENNFTITRPELVKEWDYEKNNGLLPDCFSVGSNKKVWWKCLKCNSSYVATIFHKIEGTGCPYCSGKKINETNNLKMKYPEIAKLWDYEKNKELLPENIYFSSKKKVWWKCENCGKSYKMQLCTRIKAKTNYCFECKHNHIGSKNRTNSINKKGNLVDINSPLLKEWNYERNTSIKPTEITAKSGITVWWKCSEGHEWEAKVYNRTYGTGCPYCYQKKR